jgi:hypothetical protein
MLTKQEFLILSFFENEIPKEFKYKNLTDEMRANGIGENESYEFIYGQLIFDFQNKYWLIKKPSQGITKANGLLILSESGAKQIKDYENANFDFSTNGLVIKILENFLSLDTEISRQKFIDFVLSQDAYTEQQRNEALEMIFTENFTNQTSLGNFTFKKPIFGFLQQLKNKPSENKKGDTHIYNAPVTKINGNNNNSNVAFNNSAETKQEIKVNEDLPEQKDFNRKILGLTKVQIAWTIIGIVVASLLTLLILPKTK